MNKNIAVFYNGAYKDKPDEFPRQIGRMRDMARKFDKMGARGRFLPIYFNGENVDEIHGNLAAQVRESVSEVIDDKKIFFGGDGFIGAMVNAMGELKGQFEEEKSMAARAVDGYPIMAAKGGSLNLFSKRLESDGEDALENYVEDEVDIARVETKRRVFELSAVDSKNPEKILRTESYPFSFFAGTGTDSLMLKMHEEQGRKQHWALSVVKVTAQSLANIWSNGGKFNTNSVLTIPYYGLIRLPKNIDTVSQNAFYRFRSVGESAWETSKKMLAGHVLMSSPTLSKMYLASGQDYYTLNKIEQMAPELVYPNHPEGLCFYTDGYPQIFSLREGEAAITSAYTLKDEPGVFMASFRPQDRPDDYDYLAYNYA